MPPPYQPARIIYQGNYSEWLHPYQRAVVMSPNPFPANNDPHGTHSVQVYGEGISATTLTTAGIYNSQMQPLVVTTITGERTGEEVRQNPEVETQRTTSPVREEHSDPLDFSTKRETHSQSVERKDHAVEPTQEKEVHPKPPQQREPSQAIGRNTLQDVWKQKVQFQQPDSLEQPMKPARKSELEVIGEGKVEGNTGDS